VSAAVGGISSLDMIRCSFDAQEGAHHLQPRAATRGFFLSAKLSMAGVWRTCALELNFIQMS
jgi:hypothetical protein